MKRLITIIIFLFFHISQAQFSVCPNVHYLLRDGKDFFWLGVTGWELFHRLDRKQADLYLETRKRQGFTVVQAVVLAEFDGLHKKPPRSGCGQDWILVLEDADKNFTAG